MCFVFFNNNSARYGPALLTHGRPALVIPVLASVPERLNVIGLATQFHGSMSSLTR